MMTREGVNSEKTPGTPASGVQRPAGSGVTPRVLVVDEPNWLEIFSVLNVGWEEIADFVLQCAARRPWYPEVAGYFISDERGTRVEATDPALGEVLWEVAERVERGEFLEDALQKSLPAGSEVTAYVFADEFSMLVFVLAERWPREGGGR